MQISCFFFLFIFNEQEFTNRQKSFLTFWSGSTLRMKWKQKQARKFISLSITGEKFFHILWRLWTFPHLFTLISVSSVDMKWRYYYWSGEKYGEKRASSCSHLRDSNVQGRTSNARHHCRSCLCCCLIVLKWLLPILTIDYYHHHVERKIVATHKYIFTRNFTLNSTCCLLVYNLNSALEMRQTRPALHFVEINHANRLPMIRIIKKIVMRELMRIKREWRVFKCGNNCLLNSQLSIAHFRLRIVSSN